MVRASGLKARFDNATASVTRRAVEPPHKPNPVVPWVSRPGKPLAKGTGYFRTLQAGNRWWLLDPEGRPFFDIGTVHVNYHGQWCEALGYASYNRNVAAK